MRISDWSSDVCSSDLKDGQKTWVPYDSSFRYNYAPTNYIQRSDRRYTAGASAHYELSSAAELYGSFMFMDDHSFSQAAPSALFPGELYSRSAERRVGKACSSQFCYRGFTEL